MLTRQNAEQFTKQLLDSAAAAGFDTSAWIVDHICYRTSSQAEYEALRRSIYASTIDQLAGIVLSEALVNGRPILTFRMEKPLLASLCPIEAIEVPAPKPGKSYLSGFEHIEVVITESFTDFLAKAPHINFESLPGSVMNPELTVDLPQGKIKFHHLPLSSVINIENKAELYEWLRKSQFLENLSVWQPIISGSLPLGLSLPSSDLDILLYSANIDQASVDISKALAHITDLVWHPAYPSHGGNGLLGKVEEAPLPIEIFLCDTPVLQQNSHRHLLTEYLYLVREGEQLRNKVLRLKSDGKNTEEAFALALGLTGHTLDAMLKWPKPWSAG